MRPERTSHGPLLRQGLAEGGLADGTDGAPGVGRDGKEPAGHVWGKPQLDAHRAVGRDRVQTRTTASGDAPADSVVCARNPQVRTSDPVNSS